MNFLEILEEHAVHFKSAKEMVEYIYDYDYQLINSKLFEVVENGQNLDEFLLENENVFIYLEVKAFKIEKKYYYSEQMQELLKDRK